MNACNLRDCELRVHGLILHAAVHLPRHILLLPIGSHDGLLNENGIMYSTFDCMSFRFFIWYSMFLVAFFS
jgi:hypothetical protein